MKINDIYNAFLECESVTTDTRNIKVNSLFIALKGDNFDANTFTEEALNKGARYAIIDNAKFEVKDKTILVEDTLKTLQELARFHRTKLNTTIISLTGSNGKTTTKELINVVLQKKYKTIATIGNLNNHIGVPLTLLRLSKSTEIGIIEMGANHQKEIEFLCSITTPNYGYITNFGKAHLEGFGGVEGIIKGKSELYDYLSKNDKTAIVNLDDILQKEKTKSLNRITYSTKEECNTKITSINANPMVSVTSDNTIIKSNLIGLYNADNISAAITIGQHFKIDIKDIKDAIENYFPDNNRSQIVHKYNSEIILDAYNANPSSMEAALSNFKQLNKENKVAILGDMFELGSESNIEHKKLIESQEKNVDIIFYYVGENFYKNKKDLTNQYFFKNFIDFKNQLTIEKLQNKTILIKGSRGMALERTLEIF